MRTSGSASVSSITTEQALYTEFVRQVRNNLHIVFAISNNKVNLYDFSMLFKEKLNCKNALYLDGYVSRAYIPQLGREQLDGNFGVIIGVVN